MCSQWFLSCSLGTRGHQGEPNMLGLVWVTEQFAHEWQQFSVPSRFLTYETWGRQDLVWKEVQMTLKATLKDFRPLDGRKYTHFVLFGVICCFVTVHLFASMLCIFCFFDRKKVFIAHVAHCHLHILLKQSDMGILLWWSFSLPVEWKSNNRLN